MKKLLAVLLFATIMVSCGETTNEDETTETTTENDTTEITGPGMGEIEKTEP